MIRKAYDTFYRTMAYNVVFSSMAGLGNGLGSEGDFSDAFGQGYVNHFFWGLLLNVGYPLVFNQLKKTKHYRAYANLYQVGITTLNLLAHYSLGTENPISTVAPMTAIAFPMVNKHVSETLEEKLEE